MGNFHRAKGVNQEGAFKLLLYRDGKRAAMGVSGHLVGKKLKVKKERPNIGISDTVAPEQFHFHCSKIIRKSCLSSSLVPFQPAGIYVENISPPSPTQGPFCVILPTEKMKWCTAKYKLANRGVVAAALKSTFHVLSGA